VPAGHTLAVLESVQLAGQDERILGTGHHRVDLDVDVPAGALQVVYLPVVEAGAQRNVRPHEQFAPDGMIDDGVDLFEARNAPAEHAAPAGGAIADAAADQVTGPGTMQLALRDFGRRRSRCGFRPLDWRGAVARLRRADRQLELRPGGVHRQGDAFRDWPDQ